MRVFPVHPVSPDPETIADAAARLRVGELVAFPTETVYGLGANALDADAVARIYAAKGRPSYNPIIVHVPHTEAARRVVTSWPDAAARLAAAFWPGPLTLVLPKAADIPDGVSAGLPLIGVRVPAHPVALALMRAARVPVAAPSANKSNQLSPTSAEHVARGLADVDGIILDGGPCSVGIESTVIDLSTDVPTLLRPGGVSVAALESVLDLKVQRATAEPVGEEPRRSPGALDRHYAPRAAMRIVPSGDAVALSTTIDSLRAEGASIGVIAYSDYDLPFREDVIVRMLPGRADLYARVLFAALHELDSVGVSSIVVEAVPELPIWDAVRDRLKRAAR
ncbi:MAG: L-threonylcarbamoyladenylate synthase [Gemmatimonadaceae bacterium]|nr:L-threonylcarbamoyladenylate synthase [Gemmatimonadaceae bacterium]